MSCLIISVTFIDKFFIICRESLLRFEQLVRSVSAPSCSGKLAVPLRFMHYFRCGNQREHHFEKFIPHLPYRCTLMNALSVKRSGMFEPHSSSMVRGYARERTNESIELNTDENIIRFNIGDPSREGAPSKKRKVTAKKSDVSRKAKLNELRFYRLKAKKKMNSPNPEVRIRYKLEKVCIESPLYHKL